MDPTYQWYEGGDHTPWDGLRKDVDLWDPSGDCVVYLYHCGTSKRPASVRVPLHKLYEAQCTPLLNGHIAASSSPTDSSTSDSSDPQDSACSSATSVEGKMELHLGAPRHLARQDTLRWHITTRNFFAWLTGKPLVGPHLGLALSDLLQRMAQYREAGVNNLRDLLAFADYHGYTEMSHKPDLAVAMLVFAEEEKLRDLWINAFSHCAAMQDAIAASPDFEVLSPYNRALITKAALQMDVDLEAKQRAIANLLEDDFSDTALGLSPSARIQLDHFRSFIQSHLVATFGYWPPQEQTFSKQMYATMAEEFDALYRYLGNFQAADSPISRHTASGGICVLQCLSSFNARHGYEPLGTSAPLLPVVQNGDSRRASLSFSGLKLGRSRAANSEQVRAAFQRASNQCAVDVTEWPLVRAFAQFELESTIILNAHISPEDARRVRWILICGMLQTLNSIGGAPPEVTDPHASAYPLSFNTANLPPWTVSESPAETSTPASYSSTHAFAGQLRKRSSPSPAIRPDYHTDHATYFSNNRSSNNVSPSDARLQCPADSTMAKRLSLTTASFRRNFSRGRDPIMSFTPSLESSTFPSHPVAKESQSERDPDTPTDVENDSSPDSDGDVPSLDWSRRSRDSTSTRATEVSDSESSPIEAGKMQLQRRGSSGASSVYSEAPNMPLKLDDALDVGDKGLAMGEEGFIVPGLF